VLVVAGLVLYVVLTVCLGVFVSFWAGVALVLAIPIVVWIADAVDRRSWPWR
jgi:hypothetical protein